MPVTLSLVLSTAITAFGLVAEKPFIWYPASVAVAAFIEALTRRWLASPKLGSAVALSMTLKFICAIIGVYALIGVVGVPLLLAYWLMT